MRNLFSIAAILLLATSCQQEVENVTVDEADAGTEFYSKTQLGGDTTVHKLLIDGKYTYVNEIGGEYYYSEDMTITSEQFNTLLKLTNPDLNATERATVTTTLTRYWPNNTVHYALPARGSLSTAAYSQFLTNIQVAFDMITAETDVQFVQRTNQRAYIQFVSSTGNNSPLGYTANRVNTVNIYNYNIPAIIAHEIMHSMGVHHEQTRPDRDNYIIVNMQNVQPGAEVNFNIAQGFVGVGPFDFNSVMLYASGDFAVSADRPVLTRLDGSTFGKQRTHLTAGDYEGINYMYQ